MKLLRRYNELLTYISVLADDCLAFNFFFELEVFRKSPGDESEPELRLIFSSSRSAFRFEHPVGKWGSWLTARADCSLLNVVCRDLAATSWGDDLVEETGDDGLDEMEELGDLGSRLVDGFLRLDTPTGFLFYRDNKQDNVWMHVTYQFITLLNNTETYNKLKNAE